MLEIELKNCSITNNRVPDTFRLDYKSELLSVLEFFPEGVTALDMAEALTIINKLNSANTGDVISLTEKEHKYLCTRLEKAKYTIVAPEFIAFRSDILYAEDKK